MPTDPSCESKVGHVPVAQNLRAAAVAQFQEDGDVERLLQKLHVARHLGDGVADRLIEQASLLQLSTSRPPVAYEIVCEAPPIRMWRNLFSPIECAYIVEASREALQKAMVLNPTAGPIVDLTFRVSEGRGLPFPQMDDVEKSFASRIASVVGFTEEKLLPMSVLRYGSGGIFKAHLDVTGDNNNDVYSIKDVRVSTSIVYLNADYTGGETAFIHPSIAVWGSIGDMINFRNLDAHGRPDQLALHASLPVIQGEKWVAVQWETV